MLRKGEKTSLPLFFLPYAKRHLRLFLLAILFLFAEALCDLLQPTIMALVINEGILERDMGRIFQLGGFMFIIVFVGACAAVGRNLVSSRVSQRFGADIRSALYKKIMSFSFHDLNDFETASLVTRLTNDVTQIQNFVNGTMRIFVKAPLLALGGIVMACILDIRMAPILFAVIPVVAILIAASLRTSSPLFGRIQEALDSENSVIREYLAGIRVVKAFNRFEYEADRFDRTNRELSDTTTQAMRALAVFSPGISLSVNLGIAAVLWFGGGMVLAGQVKVGNIVAFVNYMVQILSSLMMLSFIFNMFVRAMASAKRLRETISKESDSPSIARGAQPLPRRGEIEFKDVWFSYRQGSGGSVLRGIHFVCAPGETLGIIGSTGSGKSTLAALIPAFYLPSSGSVLVGGIDTRSVPLEELRESIAFVPQATNLFTGSVLENILWGRDSASHEEAEAAAKLACAHDFILGLDSGYSAQVGRGGVFLSGGQKQRIAIARALVRKPDILIIDDGTSSVDAITEAGIRQGLKEFSGGLTTILISQKISTVREADRILVLEDGALSGNGTHRELLRNCETYKEICRSQMGIGEEGDA